MQSPNARRPLPGIAVLVLLFALAPAAAAEPSPRRLMEFGVDAARQGLWREAIFRWERALAGEPANARLRNNLAVAYESVGRFADADREYREARRLDPERKSIRDNHESFLKIHPEFLETAPAKTAEPDAGAPPS